MSELQRQSVGRRDGDMPLVVDLSQNLRAFQDANRGKRGQEDFNQLTLV